LVAILQSFGVEKIE